MPAFRKLARLADLVEGRGSLVEVDGRAIALFRIGDDVHALDNACPHRGGPLAEGALCGTTVTCPWHGWQFDVSTGKLLVNPAAGVACHAVLIEGDDVLVAVSPSATKR